MHNRRRKKLIEPRLQLRFSLAFLATSFALVLVQAIVLTFLLQRVADQMPNDGMLLRAGLARILLASFAVTFLLLAPLSLAVGIRTTFPVVGPIYRFRVYLRELIDDKRPGPCRIRKGDELQDLCELLNEATAPLREATALTQETRTAEEDEGARSGGEPAAPLPRDRTDSPSS
jgi:hypothetical protein